MNDIVTYKVKVRYVGTDVYGLPRKATKNLSFPSLEKARQFKPKEIEIVVGHGVEATLSPISKEIFKETKSTIKLEEE